MSNALNYLPDWHRIAENGSKPEDLATIIADNCVFHSPVVHTPQEGKGKVIAYLAAAGQTFGDTGFQYVREITDGPHAMLEFTCVLDGIQLNGLDLMTFDDEGKIIDFKVMVRPLKAVNKIWELMGAQLERDKHALR